MIEALAPIVKEDVGVCETDGDTLDVGDAVDVGVGVEEPVPVCVAVTLEDASLVSEPDAERLEVIDADAPFDNDGVGV